MPAGSGHGVSKGSLAACGPRFFVLIVRAGRIAFRKRKAARTQAFLRVSRPSLRLFATGSARLRPKAVSD